MPRKVVHATILLFTPDSIRTLRHAYLYLTLSVSLSPSGWSPLAPACYSLLPSIPSSPLLPSPPSLASLSLPPCGLQRGFASDRPPATIWYRTAAFLSCGIRVDHYIRDCPAFSTLSHIK